MNVAAKIRSRRSETRGHRAVERAIASTAARARREEMMTLAGGYSLGMTPGHRAGRVEQRQM